MPSAAPSSVGTTTDQPISPIIPRPNHTPCAELRRALSLRSAFVPTSSLSDGFGFGSLFWGSSVIVKARHAPYEIAFHFRQHRAHASLALIQGQKLPLHRFAQPAEIPSDQRPAHGYENVRTGLDEHPFIHSH